VAGRSLWRATTLCSASEVQDGLGARTSPSHSILLYGVVGAGSTSSRSRRSRGALATSTRARQRSVRSPSGSRWSRDRPRGSRASRDPGRAGRAPPGSSLSPAPTTNAPVPLDLRKSGKAPSSGAFPVRPRRLELPRTIRSTRPSTRIAPCRWVFWGPRPANRRVSARIGPPGQSGCCHGVVRIRGSVPIRCDHVVRS
jgi:hypothetical protein